jgi:hypothetical protein
MNGERNGRSDLKLRASLARSAGLVAALGLPLAFVAGIARSQDSSPIAKLLLGPAVILDADGSLALELQVGEGVKDVKLALSWVEGGKSKDASVAVVPVAGTKKLRASLPKDLPPSSEVAYNLLSGNESLTKYTLKTLPPKGAKTFTWCALGDSGWPSRASTAEREVATKEQLTVGELLAKLDPDAVIHTGDVIYLMGQESGIAPLFFEPYHLTLARVPLFCVLGNHDVKTDDGAPVLGHLPFPANANGNRFFSFDVGNIHFVGFDSNGPVYGDDPGSFERTPEGQWLKADLASAKADWKIVYFHHPLYSSFPKRKKEHEAMRRACEKMFHECGVDLCVTGHDHFYYRSERVLDGKKDPDGIVHVLTGGGGASLYPPEPDELTAASAKRFHLVRFKVDGFKMTLEAIAPAKGGGEPEVFDKAELLSKRAK